MRRTIMYVPIETNVYMILCSIIHQKLNIFIYLFVYLFSKFCFLTRNREPNLEIDYI